MREPQLGANPELRIFVKEDLCGDSEQLHNLLEDTYDTKTGDDVYKNQKCRMRLQWGKRGKGSESQRDLQVEASFRDLSRENRSSPFSFT